MNSPLPKFAQRGEAKHPTQNVDLHRSDGVISLPVVEKPVDHTPEVHDHKKHAQQTPLEQILRDQETVDPKHLLDAITMHARQDCGLGEILLAQKWITPQNLIVAEETRWACRHIDPTTLPPDPRLVSELGADFCLKHDILPWRKLGENTVVLTCNPEQFQQIKQDLPAKFGTVTMALSSRSIMMDALLAMNQNALMIAAETCVPDAESCRRWEGGLFGWRTAVLTICFALVGYAFPSFVFAALLFWAIITLACFTGLKVAAAWALYRHHTAQAAQDPLIRRKNSPIRLPRVSILVPLFREAQVAEKLIQRLSRLQYPRELLEICLIAEADDITTRDAIAKATLPHWIRPVVVPAGELRTKPRALNFAMDFCTGSIVGVYDAEDKPDPDQIHKIVRRFDDRAPEVVCLQGVLDYYNARTNWLSRCFTIEYATWFRVVLPGIMRLGFAIPLGGTTLFFRREALEKLGRWDAHNVTEDADLGIRLARHGYRAEIVETVTREEANCRVLPWIKQRSRWLKGFAATWAVHMRDPVLLWRQLGPKKFLGFQIMFFCTLSQFALAPLLWSFWLVPLGVGHPLNAILPDSIFFGIAALFLITEILTMGVAVFSVSAKEHRHLRWWVPTLPLYFPLGALASYKGLWELAVSPFYWDKTSHGHFPPSETQTKSK